MSQARHLVAELCLPLRLNGSHCGVFLQLTLSDIGYNLLQTNPTYQLVVVFKKKEGVFVAIF